MGQRIGNLFGNKGAKIGAEAGRLFRQVTGFGDYKVESNSLVASLDRLPTFRNMSSGTKVLHREYLGDVITSSTIGAFKNQVFPIQPALYTTFPWLSASAENYQEYRLNGLVFEFKSNSYNALSSTNTASGTVVMATNYNVLESPFPNKFIMEQTQFTCSGKPSINLLHPIECAKIETPTSVLYTRSGTVTTGDLRLYDWGNFQIATVGMQGANTNIGELWVTYDVTLLKPRLGAAVDVYDHYVLPVGHFVPGGAAYFGHLEVPPTLSPDSDMGTRLEALVPMDSGLNTIVWPPTYVGNCMVVYCAPIESKAASGVSTPYSLTFAGNCRYINFIGSDTGNSNESIGPLLYNGQGGTTFVTCVSLNGGGALAFGGGTTGAPPLAGDLYIIALPFNFERTPLPALSFQRHLRPELQGDLEESVILSPIISSLKRLELKENEKKERRKTIK